MHLLTRESLKELLGQKLSDRDKSLLCLALEPLGPRDVKEVRSIASSAGWRASKNKNISNLFTKSKGLVARTNDGWELLGPGTQHIAKIAGPYMVGTPVIKVASSLRATLAKITDTETQAYVEEAIKCYEGGQRRAAVVLSWEGAISKIQDHIINTPGVLTNFNTEALALFGTRRNPFVAARNKDELGRLSESEFLVVIEKIGLIGKNVRQELEVNLKLRNGCGHPNSLKIGDTKVAALLEDLMLNVFNKF